MWDCGRSKSGSTVSTKRGWTGTHTCSNTGGLICTTGEDGSLCQRFPHQFSDIWSRQDLCWLEARNVFLELEGVWCVLSDGLCCRLPLATRLIRRLQGRMTQTWAEESQTKRLTCFGFMGVKLNTHVGKTKFNRNFTTLLEEMKIKWWKYNSKEHEPDRKRERQDGGGGEKRVWERNEPNLKHHHLVGEVQVVWVKGGLMNRRMRQDECLWVGGWVVECRKGGSWKFFEETLNWQGN